MNDVCILLSGGLDSSVMALYLQREGFRIHPFLVNYGQQNVYLEMAAAGKICEWLNLPMPLVMKTELANCLLTTGEAWIPDNRSGLANSFVPGRNLMMLTMLASAAVSRDIRTLAIGVTAEDQAQFPDCRPQFFAELRVLWQYAFPSYHFNLLTPFIEKRKEDIIKIGAAKGLPLQATWSCYIPREGLHCGECHACRVRKEGFNRSGIRDYTIYWEDENAETND